MLPMFQAWSSLPVHLCDDAIMYRNLKCFDFDVNNTRYHGVELGQVSCGKQTFTCGI